MAFQQGSASSTEHVVYSSHSVSRGCGQLVSSVVESCIENLIVVALERLDTGTTTDIPQLAGLVNRTREAVLTCEVELATTELALVSRQSMDALPSHHVPDFGSVVK